MARFGLSFLFGICATSVVAFASGIHQHFVNVNVTKTFDFSNPVARMRLSIAAKSADDTSRSKYYIALPEAEARQLAHASVVDGLERELSFAEDKSVKVPGFRHYLVTLLTPATKDDAQKIVARFSLAHTLRPFPEVVEQGGKHMVKFEGELFAASPYHSDKQLVFARLGTSDIESFTEIPGLSKKEKSKMRVRYGPFKDVKAYDSAELALHFAHGGRFVTYERANREVEVSMWGNLAIEELFDLRNDAASLSQGFSRVDMQMKQMRTGVVESLKATLPVGAKDVFYRDMVGNISTSNMRAELNGVSLEIKPRFPLFGGWRTQWYHSYNLGPDALTSTIDGASADGTTTALMKSADGKLKVTMPFMPPFEGGLVETYQTKVILPEGAYDVDVKLPSGVTVDTATDSTRHTYLDGPGDGRPVRVVIATNVVEQHTGDLVVTFRMPAGSIIREPMMLVGAYMAAFVVYLLVSRIDLTVPVPGRGK